MYAFRKQAPVKSTMFSVRYEDGRTAYMWLDDSARQADDRILVPVAAERQKTGALPPGTITSIKRVR
jgi:hypothetical protein